MKHVATGAFVVLGLGAVVVAAPVIGAVAGAALATNAATGAAIGFAAGLLGLQTPVAALFALNETPENAGKSRLWKIGKELIGMYKGAGEVIYEFAKDKLTPAPKPVFLKPEPDNEDPFRIEDLTPSFAGAATKTAAADLTRAHDPLPKAPAFARRWTGME